MLERRFERINEVTESVEEYRNGGYYPMKLHERVDSRYRILNKVGFGRSSTVWLARDEIACTDNIVVLKIFKAELFNNAKPPVLASDQEYILSPLRTISISSPNGCHRCDIFKYAFCDGFVLSRRRRRLDVATIIKMCTHLFLGLAALHRDEWIHTDLQPANILLVHNHEAELSQNPITCPVIWRQDVAPDNSAPDYLVVNPFTDGPIIDFSHKKLKFMLADLDSAIKFSDASSGVDLETPLALLPPEVLLEKEINEKMDIWSLGCTLYQLVIGESLFPICSFNSSRDDQLRELMEMHHTWSYEKLEWSLGPQFTSLQNVEFVNKILWPMLQIDPGQRPSANELVEIIKSISI